MTSENRALLSALWTFVFLNMFVRDIHEFFRAGFLQEAVGGTVNGNTVSEMELLVAGVLLQLPLLQVVLPHVAGGPILRWASLIAAPVTFLGTLAAGLFDLDDYWFAGVQFFALGMIVFIVLPRPISARAARRRHKVPNGPPG
jgi:hypothetical protein